MRQDQEIEPTENLLEDTVNVLKRHGKTFNDVLWIGTKSNFVNIGKFIELAKETNFDSGYGSQEIATDLLIVGDNWWLERGEYDGSEWWDYKEMPEMPIEELELKCLTGVDSEKLGISDWFGGSLRTLNVKSNDN